MEFNLFDYQWPICHHFFSSSCSLPPPFTLAPWCLKYGCCFYIKCCYQSTTWITMNNVSCICLPGVKTRCPTVQGWLLAGGSTCVMINNSVTESRCLFEKNLFRCWFQTKRSQNPSKWVLAVCVALFALSLSWVCAVPAQCTSTGAWRGPSL